jgi:hypothetical protein
VLNPDRSDLDFEAVFFENDPVVVTGLGMNDLVKVQGGHAA